MLFNAGGGTFEAPVVYGAGLMPTYATVADVDGDGRPDVVTTDMSRFINVLHNACLP